MADTPSRKLAVILHADVVGSTSLVRLNETIAHERIQDTFRRFSEAITGHDGIAHEIRGDALVAEFSKASDAVAASLAFQEANAAHNEQLNDEILPVVRVGIAMGEVVVADSTVTGEGVVLAQRLEQLAEPGGVCIQDAAYQTIPKRLPFDYEKLGERELKGFDEPVRVYAVSQATQVTTPHSEAVTRQDAARPDVPDKPSIAILPFVNIGGDPEQEYFADGLVDDIITMLSKLSGLLVIARDSCASFKNRDVDVRQVARELRVRYVLEGSVRKVGKRIRINVQLTDTERGVNIWAERYDRKIDDIFAVQDEITLTLATEMEIRFTEGEQARLRYTTTKNVEAWTNWVKGISDSKGPVTKDGMGQSRKHWERAVALDPDSAPLNAALGFLHCVAARFGWWDDRETEIRKATAYIENAVGLDPDDAEAHRAASFALLLQQRHDEAVAEARKAVELAPSSADIAATASFIFCSSGLAEEAFAEIEKAMQLHPNYPARYMGHLGNAHRLAGRFEEAIAVFKKYNELSPGFGLVDLVIIFNHLNRTGEAKREAARFLALRPRFTVRAWAETQFLSDAGRLESDIDALTDSGLPYDS